MAHGTVLSFSPEMIRSGPRSGFSVSTFASVHGFRLAVAAWKSGNEQAAERVADDGRLRLQSPDDLVEMVCDLPNGLVREHLGVRVGLVDGLWVVRPARRERSVAGVLEPPPPTVPAARQQPEAVDEHDWLQPRRVRTLDSLHFVLGDRRRVDGRGLRVLRDVWRGAHLESFSGARHLFRTTNRRRTGVKLGCVPSSAEKSLGVALVPAINYSTARRRPTA